MARPLTKGPVNGFRQPLDIHDVLQEYCDEHGHVLSEHVASVITDWVLGLNAPLDPDPEPVRPPEDYKRSRLTTRGSWEAGHQMIISTEAQNGRFQGRQGGPTMDRAWVEPNGDIIYMMDGERSRIPADEAATMTPEAKRAIGLP